MTWNLFLDDLREVSYVPSLPQNQVWTLARSTEEAKLLVSLHGMPALISFDHDLGGEDKATIFLNWLIREYWTDEPIPEFQVHSANPVGAANISSMMVSWHKSAQ